MCYLQCLREFFYSCDSVTPVRAFLSLSFEDSNAEYRINPYSAYFSFDAFHVTATIRNPRLFRNPIYNIFFAFKNGDNCAIYNDLGSSFIVALALQRFEPFCLSPSKIQMRSTGLVPTPHNSLSMLFTLLLLQKILGFLGIPLKSFLRFL